MQKHEVDDWTVSVDYACGSESESVYSIAQEGILKWVLDEPEARALLRVLVKSLGLEYFLSQRLVEARPDLWMELDRAVDKLSE